MQDRVTRARTGGTVQYPQETQHVIMSHTCMPGGRIVSILVRSTSIFAGRCPAPHTRATPWTPLFTLSRQIAPLFRRPTPIGESAAALQIECCPLDGGVEVFCELRDCVRPVSLIHCRVCKCVREMCVALTVLNCSPRVQYVRVAKALATYASASHMECKRRKTSHGLGFPFPPLSEKPPLSRRCQ